MKHHSNEESAEISLRPELSIVVLGYKAGEELEKFIDQVYAIFSDHRVNFECVIVANYWPDTGDTTPEVAKRCANKFPNIKVVAKEKAGMMGWDMRSGLEACNGDVLAIIDGDNQFPPNSLPTLYNKLIKGQFDMCKTVRETRADGIYRIVISRVYNLFFQMLFPGSKFADVNSKPKLMTRQAYEKMELLSNGWFIDAEIMIQARRFGFSIKEIPTQFRKNTRASFVKPIAIIEFIIELLKYRLKEFKHGK
ncbi:MAG: glycosyltransferase family 2 protein [Opitutales bacterium]|nr:glycosyltransferase family 2 protein [Opitutales bacterium]